MGCEFRTWCTSAHRSWNAIKLVSGERPAIAFTFALSEKEYSSFFCRRQVLSEIWKYIFLPSSSFRQSLLYRAVVEPFRHSDFALA
jgi:hypothetical protein